MLNVGLLGAGRIGKVHAKAISAHAGSKLVAVSDVFTENAIQLAEQYGAKVDSSENIIADPDIDAVLIATSTDTHSDLIEAAAAAGKAIMCEKPVDLDLERARACEKAVSAHKVPIMIGFNRRFDHNFASLKKASDAGEIGKPELLSITSFDPAPPHLDYIKVSGGLFRDMMIHDFDMANFIMDDLPETVFAVGTSLVDPDIGAADDVDTAVATLRYADGRLATIRNSRRAVFGYDQRLELLGSEGLIEVKNVTENTVVKSNSDGICSANPVNFFLERYMPAYDVEWATFVECVETKTTPPVTLKDGVAALAVAEAATLSATSGQPQRIQY